MIPRTFEFHTDAIVELRTIAGHSEALAFGLGSEFVSAVDDGSLRRAILHRFPFGLCYQITGSRILAFAIFPLRANPDDIAHLLTVRAN